MCPHLVLLRHVKPERDFIKKNFIRKVYRYRYWSWHGGITSRDKTAGLVL